MSLDDKIIKLAAEIGTLDPRVEQMIKEDPFGIDPLYVAEKITGRSYKDDESTTKLGLCIMQAQRLATDEINAKMDDTSLSCSINRYKRIVEEIGYELVLKIDQVVPDKGFQPNAKEYLDSKGAVYSDLVVDDNDRFTVNYHESQYFYWLNGILLVWDTFHGNRNSADLYCMSNHRLNWFYCNMVGQYNEDGNNDYFIKSDGRERIRHQTETLLRSEALYSIWPKSPHFIWFLAHWDTSNDNHDYNIINKAKFDMFPDKVRQSIKLPLN